jgi:16S rRNA processing protein RimM
MIGVVMVEQPELVTIGRIERPFGVKGEVRVASLSDVPGRFERLGQVTLTSPTGRIVDAAVTHVRGSSPTFIVGFDIFSSPEQVAEFRGGFVQVPRGGAPALPAGQYYECDLIGLAVEDVSLGPIGTIEDVWDLSGNQVFVVREAGREILVPAAKQVVVAIDLEGRTMTVRLPEGLAEC